MREEGEKEEKREEEENKMVILVGSEVSKVSCKGCLYPSIFK